MNFLSSIRFWNIFMSCIIFCYALFFIGQYNHPKAAEVNDFPPYEMIYTKPNHIPLSPSTHEEKIVLKGMITTDASSYEQIYKIAQHIESQYEEKKIDTIELTIHNKNDGTYEELPYEPISKGKIIIHYTKHEKQNPIIVQLENRP